MRQEYVEMLENQIAKSNNGIVRTKLLTFGVNVDDLSTARARLERVEADIMNNFKKLGVKSAALSGLERWNCSTASSTRAGMTPSVFHGI